MRTDRLTNSSQQALQQAFSSAVRSGHPELMPEHLLASMLAEPESTATLLIERAGGRAEQILKELNATLDKLPQVSGGGEPR